ncbi:MAG: hypothetical protein MAG715_00180 [Methanonatronarchaeales archaeon]|nr:hypothetical protein [Methanonatronarchaeales archaeon]
MSREGFRVAFRSFLVWGFEEGVWAVFHRFMTECLPIGGGAEEAGMLICEGAWGYGIQDASDV